jgi:hypothetical protein
MTSIYKYLTEEQHALDLMQRGSVFLNTLAFFRRCEDDARGDPHDAQLRYQPEGGLALTNVTLGQAMQLPDGSQFVSSARADQMFVYCLSQTKSESLAREFKAPFCVEIMNSVGFLGRMARMVQLRSRLDRNRILSGPVTYRSVKTEPMADWALPERVAFIKPETYAGQNEHRIVVGMKGAFSAENVDLTIRLDPLEPHPLVPIGNPLIIKLGDLSAITKLHRFDAAVGKQSTAG